MSIIVTAAIKMPRKTSSYYPNCKQNENCIRINMSKVPIGKFHLLGIRIRVIYRHTSEILGVWF